MRLSIITDRDGYIVDVATEKENLSRGKAFPGHVEYDDVDVSKFGGDMCLGDRFNGQDLLRDSQRRSEIQALAANEAKISARMRALAIADLKGKGEIPQDYV